MWELDSVAPLPASAPPPKAEGEKPKRSYLSRAYKGLRRAAGFKSKKTALALLPAASETAERPRPEGSAAAAAAASAAASPVNANPFASLRTLETSPKTAGTSPGIRERDASGPADADARRREADEEALAAAAAARTQPGTKKKSFSLYSAYKGFRRRVRGDFSDLGSSVKRPASLRPARGAAARGRGEGEGDGDGEEEGLPPAPAPGSPDDRESTARLLRLLRDRDAPAEEKTRAYQDALRAMLTPDVRGHRARDRGGSASPRGGGGGGGGSFGGAPHRARGVDGKGGKDGKSHSNASPRAGRSSSPRAGSSSGGAASSADGGSLPELVSRAEAIVRSAVAAARPSARGRFKVAVGDLVGDMRRRHEATVLVAGGMLRAFDELEKLEPAARAFGRVQRRTDDGEVWARGAARGAAAGSREGKREGESSKGEAPGEAPETPPRAGGSWCVGPGPPRGLETASQPEDNDADERGAVRPRDPPGPGAVRAPLARAVDSLSSSSSSSSSFDSSSSSSSSSSAAASRGHR